MRRALAVLLAGLLLVPAATAKEAAQRPEYPAEFVDLLDGWVDEAEALGAPSRDAAWYADAAPWLAKARDAQAAGRVRLTMFHLETYTEIVRGHQLVEQSAAAGNEGQRKSFIIERVQEEAAAGEAQWARVRARIHELDSEARSVQTVEKAMYAGDIALSAIVLTKDLDPLVAQFPERPGLEPDFVAALARASYTVNLTMSWAHDMLDKAGTSEGLPPLLIQSNWTNVTQAMLVVETGELPGLAGFYEERVLPMREDGEGTFALVGTLLEQRELRGLEIQRIFGDAKSRGKDVVSDAARGMRKQLNNTSMEQPRDYGLLGVFTADSIDRASYTLDILSNVTLGIVVMAWSGLDYQSFVTATLASASPVAPAPTPKNDAPLGGAVAMLALLGAAVLVARRRSR